MYTGSNPAALRSREYILQAFLKLAKEIPFSEISVKQIMAGSDLSRQTFYQIFESKEEIMEYCLDKLFADFAQDLEDTTVTNLCDIAKLFFSFFNQHKDFINLFFQNKESCILQRKCREYLQRGQYIRYQQGGVTSEQEKKYAATFVINGMVGMLEQWMSEDPPSGLSAQQLALLVCRITNTEP